MAETLQEIREVKVSEISRKLALAGVAGPIFFWLTQAILALIVAGHNPVRQTLSSLVLTPQGWVQTLGFCTFGILIMVFSAGLYSSVKKSKCFAAGSILLFLMGLGTLIIGICPTDPIQVVSLHAKIHHLVVKIVGLLFPIACFIMLTGLKNDSRWRGLALYTAFTGITVILLVGFWIIGNPNGWIDSWVGLYERIFVANSALWLAVMAIRLLSLPVELEKTGSEIEGFLQKTMSMEFWKQLGESARVVFLKVKEPKTELAKKSAVVEISKHVAFGTLLLMAARGYYRKKKAVKKGPAETESPVLSTFLYWGARGLGKRLGLAPVTNLMLTIVKEDE